MCLDSTFSVKTLRQVSLYLSDLEMNWTSSFLVQSDKLTIVLHLLLAPVGTVVKPAEHEVVRRPSPIPGGGVAMLSAESLVDAVIDWWKDKGLTRKSSCSVSCLSSAWAHTCKRLGLSQSATQLWPWISAGFVLAEGFKMSEEGVPVLGVIK